MENSNFQHIHQVSNKFLKFFLNNYSPVFVLNTGRSGSRFIQNIFKNFANVRAYHEASPNLFLYPNFAFHNQDEEKVLRNIFEASRLELLLEAKVSNKIFIESNQCLVFFIRQIKKTFPNAKFIHLTRHPGDFVVSAIKKGWHKNDTVWEKGRIKLENKSIWDKMSQIEKLSWVWNETHKFIEDFKTENPSNFYTVRLEDLIQSTEKLKEITNFINVNNKLNDVEILKILSNKVNEIYISKDEPPNMFKLKEYTRYKDWKIEDKNSLKKYVNELGQKYDYHL